MGAGQVTESRFRRRVVETLRPYDAVAVENPVHPGTPDINYAEGWIELKVVRDPAAPIPHFTPQQRVFLYRRSRAGGRAHLLVAYERSVNVASLFSAEDARTIVRPHDRSPLTSFVSWADLRDRLPSTLGLMPR